MAFLNAVAWTGIAWALLWFVMSVITIGRERNAAALYIRQAHMVKTAPTRVGVFALSVLWLIFG